MKRRTMISQMWNIIGDIPVSRRETMGDELYESVAKYLGYWEDEEEDDTTDEN